MAERKAEIKIIRVAMGDTEVDLTPDEARALKRALDDIFPEPARERFIPQPYPVPVPRWPIWPEYRRPWITWSSGLTNVTGRFEGATGTLSLVGR